MTVYKDAADTMQIEPRKRGGNRNKLFLIVAGGVLVVALAVCAVLLLSAGASDNAERVIELGTVMQGVSVGGVDISGMTRDEAFAATSGIEAQLFAQANFTVDVNGTQMNFTAQDFALKTDYQDVIEKAIAYGRTGTFDERLAAANAAKASPVDFPVTVSVDETGLKTALTALKAQLDTAPVDATATFAPWGYSAETAQDGTVTYTPFIPDLAAMKKMCATYSKRKEYTDVPELVRLSDAEMPNALRYEFFDDSKYNDDDIPEDWNIARFIYTDAVDGLVVNTDAIFDAVVSQVASGTYETIVAPVTVTPATVKLADIKNQTQLISSWTSSFRNHDDSARVYNVSMMSCLISGSVIQPGGEWSANTTVGSRNEETAQIYGWREASGIENGGFTPQYGGGACQIGSTTYNSAIRSGLTVVKFYHHSIPSEYIPIGLDATLDSPTARSDGKDLILRNDTATPFYMVSYIEPTKQTVTVEIYGVPPVNASGQQIIYKYDSEKTGRFGSPSDKVITIPSSQAPYECPDGTILSYGGMESYKFSNSRQGTRAQVWQITTSLDGTELTRVEYGTAEYPAINGTTYVLEALPTPTPTPPTDPTVVP